MNQRRGKRAPDWLNDYHLYNYGLRGSRMISSSSSRLPRTAMFVDGSSRRIEHLQHFGELEHGHEKELYGRDSTHYSSGTHKTGIKLGAPIESPQPWVNPESAKIDPHFAKNDGRKSSRVNEVVTKYGFNLPTSARLRTRNAQASDDLEERGNVLTQKYSNSGQTLAVTSGLILRGFTEKTTSHGIPHIYFATGLLKKIAWTVISIAALAALCLHLYLLISNWQKFEVGTKMNSQSKRKLTFPAVSICNYNPVKLSKLFTKAGIGRAVEESTNKANGTKQRAVLQYQLLDELTTQYAALTDEEFSEIGHDPAELALFCSFDGAYCDPDVLSYFRDPRYGNCVTFNSGRSVVNGSDTTPDLMTSTSSGPQYGLSLVLFLEQFDYVPFVSEAAGARVVIHNQSVMPFPEESAISVTVNTLTNIGLKQNRMTKLSGRYGNCTPVNENTNNIYHQKYQVDYSQTACLKTCYQREVVKECGCYDSSIPYQPNNTVFDNMPALPACNYSDECLTRITDNYLDERLSCDFCHSPCTQLTYETSISSAIWPADSYLDDFVEELAASYDGIMRRVRNVPLDVVTPTKQEVDNHVKDLVKRNFLKLNIYYDDLLLRSFEEVALYDDYQFASDVGGSFGLWVGWSIISGLEFIELFLDLLVYLCYGCCGNMTRSNRQRQH